MNELGNYALTLAWLTSLIGIICGVIGGLNHNKKYVTVAAQSLNIVAILTTISTSALAYSFIVSDFSNQYVWQFSNIDMPLIYKITAIWGGMDGSMLLWVLFHAVSAAMVNFFTPSYPEKIKPWMCSILQGSIIFFTTITLFLTNPFRFLESPFIPPDGNGLNPLLQNPYMAIHPPMLYLGFVTLAIPYAFCLGALLARETGYEWIRATRAWTLTAWIFLTIGITLGGYWAYIELGWGGFWAWDPVENASFMPWLTATAFLHSVMVQERKDMLKAWNIWLIVASYLLTVFGTFLTRSGIVQSVHAFASTDVGEIFLIYIAIIIILTAYLTYSRREDLRSKLNIESILSREAAFLMNNLVFLSILFGTFWGVMFPVFSEAITGEKQAVGVPFYNTINVPLFLILIFLMGIGPLIPWRNSTLIQLKKSFLAPLLIGLLAGLALIWAGIDSLWAVTSYALSFFVLLTIIAEAYRSYRIQRQAEPTKNITKTVLGTYARHQRRLAGLLVHFGVLVATLGITASMAHKVEREFALAPGETYGMGRFNLTLAKVADRETPNYQALYSRVDVFEKNSGKQVAVLKPELRFYKKSSETTTEVSIKKGIREDLYLVLAGLNDNQTKATFKAYINPLQGFLWVGVGIMALGSLLLIFNGTPKRELDNE